MNNRKKAKRRRFRIALSFPGEKRKYVRSVAECLAQKIGRDSVFFDEYYEEQLAVPNLDIKLQNIYKDESDLVVPFFCNNYAEKKWCAVEWNAIRAAIFSRRKDDEIMVIRFDNTEIEGFLDTSGYISVKNRQPSEIASLILQRVKNFQNDLIKEEHIHKEVYVEVLNPTLQKPPIESIKHLGRKMRISEEFIRTIISRPRSIKKMLPFRISKCCVTNEEYWTFAKEKANIEWPPHWRHQFIDQYGFPFKKDYAKLPITNVSLEDAKTYCFWRGGRLPTNNEWECAAVDGHRGFYPWGDEYNKNFCNDIEQPINSLCNVDEFGLGDTLSGVRQLAGNVWEMTVGEQMMLELRGGSYRSPCEFWGGCSTFKIEKKRKKDIDIGFRLLKTL